MHRGNETSIFRCKRCGIETRHRQQEWQSTSPLSWLTGQARTAEGWTCTKCGKRVRTRVRR
jgi:hypothetical protein